MDQRTVIKMLKVAGVAGGEMVTRVLPDEGGGNGGDANQGGRGRRRCNGLRRLHQEDRSRQQPYVELQMERGRVGGLKSGKG